MPFCRSDITLGLDVRKLFSAFLTDPLLVKVGLDFSFHWRPNFIAKLGWLAMVLGKPKVGGSTTV